MMNSYFFPSTDLVARFYNEKKAICFADLGFHLLPLRLLDYTHISKQASAVFSLTLTSVLTWFTGFSSQIVYYVITQRIWLERAGILMIYEGHVGLHG